MNAKVKNFSQQYNIIYNIFLDKHVQKDIKGTLRGFCAFLGISLGKRQAWDEKGQWPSAEDIEKLHNKMGFTYEWLVTGEGDPFVNHESKSAPANDANVQDLNDELLALYRKINILEDENKNLKTQLARFTQDGAFSKKAHVDVSGKTFVNDSPTKES